MEKNEQEDIINRDTHKYLQLQVIKANAHINSDLFSNTFTIQKKKLDTLVYVECKALYPHIIHFKLMLVSLIICLIHFSFQFPSEEIGHSINV